MNRISKTYDQFIMKLAFDELQNRDTSNHTWKQSTAYGDKDTPVRPYQVQKRKTVDYSNAEIVSAKRSKMNDGSINQIAICSDNDENDNVENDANYTNEIESNDNEQISHSNDIIEDQPVVLDESMNYTNFI